MREKSPTVSPAATRPFSTLPLPDSQTRPRPAMIVPSADDFQGGGTLRRSNWWPTAWRPALRNTAVFAIIGVSSGLIWRLGWQAQVVAWPLTAVIVAWLTAVNRSQALAAAPPVPDLGDLPAVEVPASGRTGELSAATAVQAAGSLTLTGAIRNSRRAGSWHPAGDPEADRRALLAGQAFRVVALRRNGGRGKRRPLPLAIPSRIVLTRPVA